jgi:hypothetical protein
MNNILNLNDIYKLRNINEEAVKIFLSAAEERLKDALETKKQLEQKSFILFSGYITTVIALFGLSLKFTALGFWFNLTAIPFCIAMIPLLLSFKASKYGNMGRHPKDWLENDKYLTVEKENLSHIYAYMLYSFVGRIDQSNTSNKKKACYLNYVILLGMLSICPFIIKVLCRL